MELDQKALEAAVLAHDKEEAAMRGEPDPWADDRPEDEFADRIAAMEIGVAAFLAPLPPDDHVGRVVRLLNALAVDFECDDEHDAKQTCDEAAALLQSQAAELAAVKAELVAAWNAFGPSETRGEPPAFAVVDLDHLAISAGGGLPEQIMALEDRAERAEAALAEKDKALADERRRATDAEYFNIAYRNMLGPVGRKVAEMWREKGVGRVHFDWGPDADNLTGEERAQFILDIETLPREPLDFGDGKGPRAARRALAEQEKGR